MSKMMTKTDVLKAIATKTGLSQRAVADVFEAIPSVAALELERIGIFHIPGIIKITQKVKPATEAMSGVPNPFKPGEVYDVKAKPARKYLKFKPLKLLKDVL